MCVFGGMADDVFRLVGRESHVTSTTRSCTPSCSSSSRSLTSTRLGSHVRTTSGRWSWSCSKAVSDVAGGRPVCVSRDRLVDCCRSATTSYIDLNMMTSYNVVLCVAWVLITATYNVSRFNIAQKPLQIPSHPRRCFIRVCKRFSSHEFSAACCWYNLSYIHTQLDCRLWSVRRRQRRVRHPLQGRSLFRSQSLQALQEVVRLL